MPLITQCVLTFVQHYGLYQMTNNVIKYTDEQYKAIYNYRKMIDINQITVSEVRHGYINQYSSIIKYATDVVSP